MTGLRSIFISGGRLLYVLFLIARMWKNFWE